MSHPINLTRIKAVSNALSCLEQPIVFIGGATVSLYIDEIAYTEIRPTEDVDVLLEIVTYGAYDQLLTRLLEIGFQPDASSGVICRHVFNQLTVDIMPTGEEVLGFSNRWYTEGFKHSIIYEIDAQHAVRIFSVPY
jgi:hypothetical protein